MNLFLIYQVYEFYNIAWKRNKVVGEKKLKI